MRHDGKPHTLSVTLANRLVVTLDLVTLCLEKNKKNGIVKTVMAQSTSARAATFILRESVGELLYFPVWWYSHGFALTARKLLNSWLGLSRRLSLVILLRTMGKPMYGDYTRSGKIISFFFRLLILGVRLVQFGVWTCIELILLVAWLLGPILVAAMLVRQIIPIS